MSVEKLKEYLSQNPDEIIKILKLADFYSISFLEQRNEIRCAYYEGGNPTSVLIKCDTLHCVVFSKGISGDLFYLIKTRNNWSLFQTINFIKNVLNIKDLNNISVPYIFNGFHKRISRYKNKKKNIIDKQILDTFLFAPCKRFLDDHISLATQYKFGIRYDAVSNRIIVPWFDLNGNLVGITSRYNFNSLGNIPKWKTWEGFSKGNFLYGIYENKNYIYNEADYVIIGESEKFVMQLNSFGYYNGLALGNCSITDVQARIIKTLPVKKIILALDEGVNSEHILKQCEKLKGGIFNNNKEVWCIYDGENKIMKKGSKKSPSDFTKEEFEYLLNNCCYKKE